MLSALRSVWRTWPSRWESVLSWTSLGRRETLATGRIVTNYLAPVNPKQSHPKQSPNVVDHSVTVPIGAAASTARLRRWSESTDDGNLQSAVPVFEQSWRL